MRDLPGDRTFLKLFLAAAAHGDEHAEGQPVGFAEQAHEPCVLFGEAEREQNVDGKIAEARGLEALKRQMVMSFAPPVECLPPLTRTRNLLASQAGEIFEI